MLDTLVPAILGLAGSVAVAAMTYWTTKLREREAEWRKEKLAYYKEFIESLSGVVEGDDTPDGHRAYARATNNLLLFAPQAVIQALDAHRSENSLSNREHWSQERHDQLLAELLLVIRKDIGVYPTDIPATFAPKLWASGTRKNAT